MGGPGSGKGVLAKNLNQMNHFSIGEALRDIINDPTHPRAALFKKQIEQGKLLDDDEIITILSNAHQLTQETPVLLDGFPRTLSQWNKLKQINGLPAAIIDLSVSEETMRNRLSNRGRIDDKVATIEYRISDYLNNTQPMAKCILQEVTPSLIIETDSSPPEKVAEKAKEFLENQRLYPISEFFAYKQ